MKRFYKIFVAALIICFLILVSVLPSFASNVDYALATNSFTSITCQIGTLLVTVPFTTDLLIDVGDTFGINLSLLCERAFASYSSTLVPSNYTNFIVYFNFRSVFLPEDIVIIENIPGFYVNYITASGTSRLVSTDTINNLELITHGTFTFEELGSFTMYDSANNTSQITSLLDVKRLVVSFQATAEDEDNGFREFTLDDFINNGPYVLCFGPQLFYYRNLLDLDYDKGFREGYNKGTLNKQQAVNEAYDHGKLAARNEFADELVAAEEKGYTDGWEECRDTYAADRYWMGYQDGAEHGGFNLSMIPEAYIGTAYTYVTSLFNYDLFGWNLLAVIGALMVVVVLVFILKKCKVF